VGSRPHFIAQMKTRGSKREAVKDAHVLPTCLLSSIQTDVAIFKRRLRRFPVEDFKSITEGKTYDSKASSSRCAPVLPVTGSMASTKLCMPVLSVTGSMASTK